MTETAVPRPGGEVVVYEAPSGEVSLDVRLEHETVWLTLRQMAELFGRDRTVVNRHILNVYDEGELERGATCAKFAQVRHEGARRVSREIEHFDLDVIISVGYRVKSLQGKQFRQWATRTLGEYLVRGYILNERCLAERGLREARETLDLLARTLRSQSLASGTGEAVLDIITAYADTWRLLLEYDEDRLVSPPGTQPPTTALDHDGAMAAIADLKAALVERGEASSLFGIPRGEVFEGILGNVEQTMFGEPLYGTREQKAANLLYFLVKDHPFTDGNKRIGSLLFLPYLSKEGLDHDLHARALTAVTLLVAESAPSNKDLMVRLIVHLLTRSQA